MVENHAQKFLVQKALNNSHLLRYLKKPCTQRAQCCIGFVWHGSVLGGIIPPKNFQFYAQQKLFVFGARMKLELDWKQLQDGKLQAGVSNPLVYTSGSSKQHIYIVILFEFWTRHILLQLRKIKLLMIIKEFEQPLDNRKSFTQMPEFSQEVLCL